MSDYTSEERELLDRIRKNREEFQRISRENERTDGQLAEVLEEAARAGLKKGVRIPWEALPEEVKEELERTGCAPRAEPPPEAPGPADVPKRKLQRIRI